MICHLVGGSHLYGLNTPESDVDFRGVFCATHPTFLAGLNSIESIVTNGEIDSTYYELVHFFRLLKKSNTQVLEILFAPDGAFRFKDDRFDKIQQERYSLFNSEQLKKSLQGYFYSELRLATGERTGRLGGKRKQSVDKFGFSPKNFTQILRICEMGRTLFKEGEVIVDSRLYGCYDLLMDIKTNPQNYTKEHLVKISNDKFHELVSTMDASKVKYEFDEYIAADFIIEAKFGCYERV